MDYTPANSSYVFSGVFREEIPFYFLQLISTELMNCLRNIYMRVSHKYDMGTPEGADIFARCVRTIGTWSPSKRDEEMTIILNKYPKIHYYYKYTYYAYIQEILKARVFVKPTDRYVIGSFEDLVFQFYCIVSEDPNFQDVSIVSLNLDRFLFISSMHLRTVFTEFVEQITIKQMNLQLTEENVQRHLWSPPGSVPASPSPPGSAPASPSSPSPLAPNVSQFPEVPPAQQASQAPQASPAPQAPQVPQASLAPQAPPVPNAPQVPQQGSIIVGGDGPPVILSARPPSPAPDTHHAQVHPIEEAQNELDQDLKDF